MVIVFAEYTSDELHTSTTDDYAAMILLLLE